MAVIARQSGSERVSGHCRLSEPNGPADRPRQTWTAHRVGSLRRVLGIHGYRSADKNSACLAMSEAAAQLGVTHHKIRRLIQDKIIVSEQLMPGAPHQIRVTDLESEQVVAALKRTGHPCRVDSESRRDRFSSSLLVVARAAGRFRLNTKTERFKIQCVDEGIDHPHGMIFSESLIEPQRGEERGFPALDKPHHAELPSVPGNFTMLRNVHLGTSALLHGLLQ